MTAISPTTLIRATTIALLLMSSCSFAQDDNSNSKSNNNNTNLNSEQRRLQQPHGIEQANLRGQQRQEQHRDLQSCTFTPSVFNAFLAVNFFGDLGRLMEDDKTALETAVRDAYNSQAELTCDTQFRRISQATILDEGGPEVLGRLLGEDAQRQLQQEVTVDTQRFTLLFAIEGTCRDCVPDSTLLFDATSFNSVLSALGIGGSSNIIASVAGGVVRRDRRDLFVRKNRGNTNTLQLNGDDLQQMLTTGSAGSNPNGRLINIFRGRDIPEFFFRLSNFQSCECALLGDAETDHPPTLQGFLDALNAIVISGGYIDVRITAEDGGMGMGTGTETYAEGEGSVVDAVQVEEVTCQANDITNFESQVFVEALGDPTAITERELEIMGQNFLDSFDFVNDRVCDPFFHDAVEADVEIVLEDIPVGNRQRRILQVFDVSKQPREDELMNQLLTNHRANEETRPTAFEQDEQQESVDDEEEEEEEERRLQITRRTLPPDFNFGNLPGRNVPGTGRSQSDPPSMSPSRQPVANAPAKFVPFRFRFAVRGKCRGCPAESVIFDDGFRRLKAKEEAAAAAASMEVSPDGRRLSFVQDDTCYCAVNALEKKPEATDFTVRFNQVVQEQVQEGILENVGEVVETIEARDIIPSAAPSSEPSKSPSHSPTQYPTAPTDSPQPSPSPTETPTVNV